MVSPVTSTETDNVQQPAAPDVQAQAPAAPEAPAPVVQDQPQAEAPAPAPQAVETAQSDQGGGMEPPQTSQAVAQPQGQPQAPPQQQRPSGNGSSTDISMKALLEAGVHFGHQTKRWNPKMKPYIFTERGGIHIIDLQQTVSGLRGAMGYVSDLTSNGGKVLFVGTKKQAQEAIREEAERASQYFVNKRWMGGMLTNFRTIKARLRLPGRPRSAVEHAASSPTCPRPRRASSKSRSDRLNALLGGIKEMRDLPDAIFIVDPHRERIAITEAIKLGIPVVAMVDTNCDPDEVDYVIPSNDDAIRAVRVITAKVADAAVEGQQRRESLRADDNFTVEPGEYSFAPDDEEEV